MQSVKRDYNAFLGKLIEDRPLDSTFDEHRRAFERIRDADEDPGRA